MTTLTPTAPAVIERPASKLSIAQTLEQVRAMAWRALKMMRRNPEQFFDVTLQPLLFTAMFAYIFGGAISGSVREYLPILIPGILAQTAVTASMAAGVQLREDMDKGVFERFRSLPIARIAPLAGPMVADISRYTLATVLTLVTGFAMGFRPGGGLVGTIAGAALIIFAGWSCAWVFTWVGTIARSARSVQGISMMIMFPLSFMSNAYVPERTLPGWLAAFVKINPISHVVTATRDLINDGAMTAQVGWALFGCVALIAIFAPLSLRSYQRHL
jgi:ABC-2 type transport system permease protein